MKRLKRDFFRKNTLFVAENLLGKILHVKDTEGIIVETEAYLPDDPASHSFKGKTTRNEAMFEKAGTLYVYKSYGIHFCVNISTEKENIGAAVLIRGIIPLEKSLETIKKRRGSKVLNKNLCNGPGKICRAFDIKLTDNFTDITESEDIFIYDNNIEVDNIKKTPRIGITKAQDKLWRFIKS